MSDAFWLDWDYDRDQSKTGSRYGDYLDQYRTIFRHIDAGNPAVEFAATAWQIATGPIMAPPLVRRHRRVTSVTVTGSDWNQEMTADVTLITPRPRPFAHASTADGGYYYDQPFDDAFGVYEHPSGQDLECRSYLLTASRVLWQLPSAAVPDLAEIPPAWLLYEVTAADRRAMFDHAVVCLNMLVDEINQQLNPIIKKLES